jgi:two-component system sensor histidine kinase PilS (NtrC family)
MESKSSSNEWLPWLGRVRLLSITFLVGVVVAVRQFTPISIPTRALIPLAALWYTLAALYIILLRLIPKATWHAASQMIGDLVIVTGVVYFTGAQDSYFIPLYVLAILMGSILFSRGGAFLVAAASFVLLGSMVGFAYYGVIPRTANSVSRETLESWLAINLFFFFATAFLGSLLAQNLRKKGVELEEKSEELKDLQAFNQDIIESMRGGLLTTDLQGRILVLNRAGAEIAGRGLGLVRGESVANVFPGFWPVEADAQGNPAGSRREVEFRSSDGTGRYLGVSISPLRAGQNRTTGYVFNFQDLTELKRLEREVATKERMAALGRLSAGIAHEIRQPLTAMTGALKELARFAPLEEDDKQLVRIVTRESQRLNKIITDFLDYSRDKSYTFAQLEIAPLIEETLLLLERDAAARGKFQIERKFAAHDLRVMVDRDAIKQVFWNLCNNALRAMPGGGILSVGLDGNTDWVRISIKDTGVGLDPSVTAQIFEPFQSGFTGGTGLGLAIVYRILQAHGGRIRVEAQQGQGAEFIVELPRSEGVRETSRKNSVKIEEVAHQVGRNS